MTQSVIRAQGLAVGRNPNENIYDSGHVYDDWEYTPAETVNKVVI